MQRDFTEEDYQTVLNAYLQGERIPAISNSLSVKKYQLYLLLPRLRSDRDKKVAEYLQDGLNAQEISRLIGVTSATVKKIIERVNNGIIDPITKQPVPDKLMEDFQHGLLLSEIANKYGLPTKLVRKIRDTKIREFHNKNLTCNEIANIFWLSPATVIHVLAVTQTAENQTIDERIREYLRAGKNEQQVAQILGLPVPEVKAIRAKHAPKLGLSPEVREKYSEVTKLYREGWTYEQIGAHYGISRERVRQILKSALVDHKELKRQVQQDRKLKRKEERKQKLQTALEKLFETRSLESIKEEFGRSTIEQLTEKYNIDAKTITQIRNEYNISCCYTKTDYDLIKEMSLAGVPAPEIAKRVNRSLVGIRYVIRVLRAKDSSFPKGNTGKKSRLDADKLIELYNLGKEVQDIADELGFSVDHIKTNLRLLALAGRVRRRPKSATRLERIPPLGGAQTGPSAEQGTASTEQVHQPRAGTPPCQNSQGTDNPLSPGSSEQGQLAS